MIWNVYRGPRPSDIIIGIVNEATHQEALRAAYERFEQRPDVGRLCVAPCLTSLATGSRGHG